MATLESSLIKETTVSAGEVTLGAFSEGEQNLTSVSILSMLELITKETSGEGEVQAVDGNGFREQNNVEKKTAVTKAVYFEPVHGGNAKYYIDNVSIKENEPSVKIKKISNWYTFDGLSGVVTNADVSGYDKIGGTATGDSMTIAKGTVSAASKKVDGIQFASKCRIKGTEQYITVPVTDGAIISSASSSTARDLSINGKKIYIDIA